MGSASYLNEADATQKNSFAPANDYYPSYLGRFVKLFLGSSPNNTFEHYIDEKVQFSTINIHLLVGADLKISLRSRN